MTEQRPWAIRVTVLASDDELDAITDRIAEAICSPSDHPGPCATPWSLVSAPVADLDEPERSAWLPYVDELMLARVTIVPDSKDWTWVLGAPCPECGFRADSFAREEIPARLRANLDGWRAVFAGPDDLRARPRPDKWSPLEYGCHVRDVFRLYKYRLELMLTEDDPAYPNWDQDETAVKERYGEQDPAVVGPELAAAGARLADAFEALHGDQWLRTGNRSDGAKFTVESFARYLLHDPVHHLYDVTGRPSA